MLNQSINQSINQSEHPTVFELNKEIQFMIHNKKRKSEPYTIPESISSKAKRALIDLEENHDNSFAVEMFLNNIGHFDNTTILYRDRKINGYEFWTHVFRYAKALKALGLKKGDIIPVMMSNCPEFFYTMVAIDLIGAIMNIVGTWFNPDYLKDIFIKSNCQYIFVTDDINDSIIYGIENANNIKKVIIFSLTDSLMKDDNGIPCYPYSEYDNMFGHFRNNIEKLRNEIHKQIWTKAEFEEYCESYNGKVIEDMVLGDPCIITYTSGTTSPGKPKGCLHSNRNYLSLARFKRSDVSTMPAVKKVSVLAHAPSYTQTVLSTSYTDPLYMGFFGWTTILEPYYELEFYPYSLIINKPNYTVETPEYEKYVAKLLDTTWKNVKMRERICVCIAGQELSPGLEYYLNKISKKHMFGTGRMPFPISPVAMSIAGGTTENGGYLVTLFKALQEKKPSHFFHKDPMLLEAIGLAEMEVLAPDGKRCDFYERGICVVNTPTNQIRYVEDEYNRDTELVDVFGKIWRTTGTPGYKDKYGCIRFVDRPNTDLKMDNGTLVPLYIILDPVKSDIRNIMEAYLVCIQNNDSHDQYIIHIEKQPDSKTEDRVLFRQITNRLQGTINQEILDNLYFRIRSFEEGFPISGTGKTDMEALKREGLYMTVKAL